VRASHRSAGGVILLALNISFSLIQQGFIGHYYAFSAILGPPKVIFNLCLWRQIKSNHISLFIWFRISAPVPLSAEALSLLGDAPAWTRSTNRNVSERSSSSHSTANGGGINGMATIKQPSNHQQSADLCDQLHLTPRQKQMCVQGGDGLAETLLEGKSSVYTSIQVFELLFPFWWSFLLIESSHSHVRVHMSATIRVWTMELHTRSLADAHPKERSDINKI
jgi:hypothetical protein